MSIVAAAQISHRPDRYQGYILLVAEADSVAYDQLRDHEYVFSTKVIREDAPSMASVLFKGTFATIEGIVHDRSSDLVQLMFRRHLRQFYYRRGWVLWYGRQVNCASSGGFAPPVNGCLEGSWRRQWYYFGRSRRVVLERGSARPMRGDCSGYQRWWVSNARVVRCCDFALDKTITRLWN